MEPHLTSPAMVPMVPMVLVRKPCTNWRLGNVMRPHRKAGAFGPLLGGSFAHRFRRRRGRSKKSLIVVLPASRTELLVDADAHSIDLIRQAITSLEEEGRKVETTLFAAPRRVENKKWCQFMQEPGITFEAVARSTDSMAQPNNKIAIQRTLRSFSKRDDVAHVALLTSDKAFLDALVELQASRTSALVLVPDSKRTVVSKYSDANLKVLKLQMSRNATRVQAILRDNGDGSVRLVDPYKRFDNKAEAELVIAFLLDLGFMRSKDDYLIQAAAKFWFANRLGPLTVFPAQIATMSVYEEIMTLSKTYEACHGNFVFFLPVSSRGSMSKKAHKTYGSEKARQIFRGGGPFMLFDSLDLTAQALRRLGYLDDDLNDDLTEALFCFLNASANKVQLTRVGALPGSGARSSDVCEHLRAAFRSQQSAGQWQYMRKDETSMASVLRILQNAKVLAGTEYVPKEVLEAMRMYSEQHGLPSMRTFNGYAMRILRSVENNPTSRGFLEINK